VTVPLLGEAIVNSVLLSAVRTGCCPWRAATGRGPSSVLVHVALVVVTTAAD